MIILMQPIDCVNLRDEAPRGDLDKTDLGNLDDNDEIDLVC